LIQPTQTVDFMISSSLKLDLMLYFARNPYTLRIHEYMVQKNEEPIKRRWRSLNLERWNNLWERNV